FNSAKVDITNAIKLEEIFSSFKPEVTIHTAAVSSPNKALELPPKTVYKINVNAAAGIANLCKKYNSKLIYTSTDLVYAGYRGSMLKENAKLIPISLYAETKLMGEQKICETFDNYIILRTALLFGFGMNGRSNFFHEVYLKLKSGNSVNLFYNQYRTPLALQNAAEIIEQICNTNVKEEIINFGGSERVSRVELGEILCDAAGFDKNLINKISMYEIPDLPHVEDVSMNTDKLQSYGIKQKSIEQSIREILSSIK